VTGEDFRAAIVAAIGNSSTTTAACSR
jgi:hypothetical protein